MKLSTGLALILGLSAAASLTAGQGQTLAQKPVPMELQVQAIVDHLVGVMDTAGHGYLGSRL